MEEKKPIFTSVEDLENFLKERQLEGTVYFEKPDYVTAIIGLSDDDRLVYDCKLPMN